MDNSLQQVNNGNAAFPATQRRPWREALLSRRLEGIEAGRLTVQFPSGRRRTFGGSRPGPNASLVIHDLALVNRLLLGGDLGLAESYMAGEWDSPDLSALLALGPLNASALSSALSPSWFSRGLSRLYHARRANTRRGSRRNIAAHYDLGNAFYRLWLDDSMTYSSALFRDCGESLAEAQRRKYVRLATQSDLRPGDRVLEIGCGWGGFAEIAARDFGCEVVCLTLSREQAAYARDRIARAGLSDKVEIRLQDYRDVTGQFDKIVSIEMFEAVGQENWPTYFATVDRCLKPGGRAALQIITIADENFESYRRTPDFIQRYIFPGGMLPSPDAFGMAVEAADMRIADSFFFGRSYAETLRRWDTAFHARRHDVTALGFDERFLRMWRYYLSYCEVGFDFGQIDVGHFVIERR